MQYRRSRSRLFLVVQEMDTFWINVTLTQNVQCDLLKIIYSVHMGNVRSGPGEQLQHSRRSTDDRVN